MNLSAFQQENFIIVSISLQNSAAVDIIVGRRFFWPHRLHPSPITSQAAGNEMMAWTNNRNGVADPIINHHCCGLWRRRCVVIFHIEFHDTRHTRHTTPNLTHLPWLFAVDRPGDVVLAVSRLSIISKTDGEIQRRPLQQPATSRRGDNEHFLKWQLKRPQNNYTNNIQPCVTTIKTVGKPITLLHDLPGTC